MKNRLCEYELPLPVSPTNVPTAGTGTDYAFPQGVYYYRQERGWGWRMVGWLAVLGCGALVVQLSSLSGTGFAMAHYLFLVICLIALCVMSIPRYILITGHSIEIHCLVEVTMIELKDIISVERIECGVMKKALPVASASGFGGYYGYFFCMARRRCFKLYTAKRALPHLLIRSHAHRDIIIPVLWQEHEDSAL